MKRKRFQRKKDQLDLVLAALADPLRRAILDDLDTHVGITIKYLREEIPLTRQGVRKHLAELMRAGIVIHWRDGRTALYYLDPRPIRNVVAVLGRRYRRDVRPLAYFDRLDD